MKKEDPIKNSEDVIDTKTVEPDSPSKNKNQIIILVILLGYGVSKVSLLFLPAILHIHFLQYREVKKFFWI